MLCDYFLLDIFMEIGYREIDVIRDLVDEFLRDNGFNAPKSYLDINSVMKQINEGKLKYPIVVKPRQQMMME